MHASCISVGAVVGQASGMASWDLQTAKQVPAEDFCLYSSKTEGSALAQPADVRCESPEGPGFFSCGFRAGALQPGTDMTHNWFLQLLSLACCNMKSARLVAFLTTGC